MGLDRGWTWRLGPLAMALLLICGPARGAAAAWSPADSAAVARATWREAREARAHGDPVGAMLKADRAHDAWPTQWYYAYGLATLAAEAGATSSERSRLRMGSKATIAAAGSSMTWMSSTRRW